MKAAILFCIALVSVAAIIGGADQPTNILPARLVWTVTTNWTQSPFTQTTLVAWDGKGENPNTTYFSEQGVISSNLMAEIVWKGRTNTIELEMMIVGFTNRFFSVETIRVYK